MELVFKVRVLDNAIMDTQLEKNKLKLQVRRINFKSFFPSPYRLYNGVCKCNLRLSGPLGPRRDDVISLAGY